jgi:O-antigen/teichoic acid export membrane protein
MKAKLIHIIKHPLFSGSAVMIVGTNFNNAVNYLYHVFMGRMLGPAGYGEMASLLSLIILVSTIPSSLNLALVKFVSGSKHPAQTSQIVGWFFSRALVLGVIIACPILLFSPWLKNFLRLSSVFPVILVGLSFLFVLPAIVLKAALQGEIKFNQFITVLLTESGTKLGLSIGFVMIGWSVFGSMAGIFAAAVCSLFLCLYFIKKFPLWPATTPIPLSKFFKYSFPVLIYSVAGTSFFTTDLILVKHFFTSSQAGTYAALSTLGKIIIFGSGPVAGVMFPIVSKRLAQGLNYTKVFWAGFLLTLGICSAVLLVYLLVPNVAISLLYGHQYLQAASLLFPFGVFISCYSLASFLIGFFLSLNFTKVILIPSLAAVFQILGITLFHGSLLSVISVSVVISAVMLIVLLALLRGKITQISL